MLKILFICSQNKLRSPTAERVFRDDPRFDVRSAGIDRDAQVVMTVELLEWADVVFVMEKRHRTALRRRFGNLCYRKRIICLHVPDQYEFMDPELVRVLEARVRPILDDIAPSEANGSVE